MKPQYYIPSTVVSDFTGPSLFDFLRREFFAVHRGIVPWLQQKVTARFGQMSSNVQDPMADLGAAWQSITDYDAGPPAGGVALDPVAGTVSFPAAGTYLIDGRFLVEHAETTADRKMSTQLKNVDTVDTVGPFSHFTARNTGATEAVFSALVRVLEPGTTLVVQISSQTASYTGVKISSKQLTIQAVSP